MMHKSIVEMLLHIIILIILTDSSCSHVFVNLFVLCVRVSFIFVQSQLGYRL
jgi:hypothetical protein